MDLRFINGSSVNRCWGDESTELVAGFQYENDAIQFAKSKLAEDVARKWLESFYVVHDTCNGKMTVIRHKPSPQVSADV